MRSGFRRSRRMGWSVASGRGAGSRRPAGWRGGWRSCRCWGMRWSRAPSAGVWRRYWPRSPRRPMQIFWLAEARQRTVREVKALVLERRVAAGLKTSGGAHLEVDEEPFRVLTVTVSREDAWCFEQARLLGRHLGERTDAELMFGLVAESTSTLCGELPRSVVVPAEGEGANAQRAWEQELAKMRAEAERRCEAKFRERRRDERDERDERDGAAIPCGSEMIAWPRCPEAIDQQLRQLAGELVVREASYGGVLDAFFSADGWRRLGYATAAQYARERLGSSLSSVKDKRRLSRRLRQLRFLAAVLERGELGYEAARLVAGVATPSTERAWVERAKERTLRHLREDIDAAELTARWSDNPGAVLPPSDADVRRVAELGASSRDGPDFSAACHFFDSRSSDVAASRQHRPRIPALGGSVPPTLVVSRLVSALRLRPIHGGLAPKHARGRLRTHLCARSAPLSQSLLRSARCDTSPSAISLTGWWRRR
jgi:hypothetical protein